MEKINKLTFSFLFLIVSSYLIPTVSGIPHMPATVFYIPFWLFLLLISSTKMFFTKGFLLGYLFLIFHFIYLVLDFHPIDRNTNRYMIDEVLPILFSFSLFEYMQNSKRVNDYIRITNLVSVGTILTTITSGLSLKIHPSAARALAGSLDSQELARLYYLIGIGGFYFYIYLALLSPIYIFVILRTKNKKVKIWSILIYITTFYTILLSQYTASIMFFVIASIATILYLKVKKIMPYLFVFMLSVFLFMNKEIVTNFIISISNNIDLENVAVRLKNIAYTIEGSEKNQSEEDIKYSAAYDELKGISINSFNENILTGGGKIGDHVFWIDVLGNYGLIGLIPWLLLFYYLYKSRSKLFYGEFKGVYKIVLFCFVFTGFHKPIRSFSMLPFIIFFIPVILLKVQNWMTTNKSFFKS